MGFFSSSKKSQKNLSSIWKEASQQQNKNTKIGTTGKPGTIQEPIGTTSLYNVNNLKQIWIEASSKDRYNVKPVQPVYNNDMYRNDPHYHDNNDFDYISNLQNSSNDVITVNGMTGVWVNKEECLNWRGPIPLEQYRINQDPNPTVIRKKRTMEIDATQRISVRFLKPPVQPVPGELIIREENNMQLPPAPPIIIRQQAAAVQSQAPIILREKPPKPPTNVPVQTITIPGERKLDPPPRQVIIERVPAVSTTPQDVVVERWLSYPRQRRNIIYEKSTHQQHSTYQTPQNIIIDWETTGHVADTNVNKKIQFLGVEEVSPIEYANKHMTELIDAHKLPQLVNEYKTPQEEVLASNLTQNEPYILTGDVDALKLVNQNELNKYLLTKF